MWHVIEKFNRRIAKKVSASEAFFLEEHVGGTSMPHHTPREYISNLKNGPPIEGKVMGYSSSNKPIYNYGQYKIFVGEDHVLTVTRKKDAFRIMTALKRDYPLVVIRW